ncbi:YozE family protein [Sphingobacterium cellulitidis]|uniref:hypothetical protein n=1 Tax=Sphingobacterium cellulitidis TaxID=1768011 RepID=UPI000B940292|nr:hypothetical protein CHT99_01065 [Sphingobacterium cellulitidis]
MQFEITKKCADSLRSFSLEKFGIPLKSSHAHELVAAYFGYSSRASLLSDSKRPISNLTEAEFIVLTPTAFIKERCKNLQGLREDLVHELAEGVYSPLYDEKWITRQSIWPTLEELGRGLADQHLNSKLSFFGDLKVQRHGVKLEFHEGEVAIAVFREYVSPSQLLSFQQGKKGVVDVFNLRRVAGSIGYIKTSHYSTEAETLDEAIVKMRDGYHQMISSAELSVEASTIVEPELSFSNWLTKQKIRNSPLGDLASKRGFSDGDERWPLYSTLEDYRDYLTGKNPPLGAMRALESAWKSYQNYLKKKKSPSSVKNVKRSPESTYDSRKIVFIKNITPLPYSKRTIENFVPGDKAWVSWEGKKAIPVTIVEVDERYYMFRIERPIKQAGEEHYVRLDEVRSTPELACINHVTS